MMYFIVQHLLFYAGMKFILPVIWSLVILVLCAIPGKDLPHVSFLEILAFDKWVHAGIFFVLVLLFSRASVRAFEVSRIKAIQFVFLIISVMYGGALEIMQGALFEDRSADVLDFIANSLGAIAGYYSYPFLAGKMTFLK